VPREVTDVLKQYNEKLEAKTASDFIDHLEDWEAVKGREIKGHMRTFFRALASDHRTEAWNLLLAGASGGRLRDSADSALVDCAYFFSMARSLLP
jgi:hypothetical protein